MTNNIWDTRELQNIFLSSLTFVYVRKREMKKNLRLGSSEWLWDFASIHHESLKRNVEMRMVLSNRRGIRIQLVSTADVWGVRQASQERVNRSIWHSTNSKSRFNRREVMWTVWKRQKQANSQKQRLFVKSSSNLLIKWDAISYARLRNSFTFWLLMELTKWLRTKTRRTWTWKTRFAVFGSDIAAKGKATTSTTQIQFYSTLKKDNFDRGLMNQFSWSRRTDCPKVSTREL